MDTIKRIIAVITAIAGISGFSACKRQAPAPNLPIETPAGITQTMGKAENYTEAQKEFAYMLLRGCYKQGGNTLVSPASVQTALALAANGADGETYTEMRDAILGGIEVEKANEAAAAFQNDECLKTANSMWLNSDCGFTLEDGFAKISEQIYKAKAAALPFNDNALKTINGWVKEHTDGMIDKILDQFDPNSAALLVNALAFDAKWESEYRDNRVLDGKFTNSDGSKADVKMMHGEERQYLDDGKATGFIKPYAGGKYAFAALLPNEGVSMEEYLEYLSPASIAAPESCEVTTAMPKFSLDYETDLNEVLKGFGMVSAFDESTADFTKLGKAAGGVEVYISRVLHKTHIDVYEGGTKAAAVTGVEWATKSAINPEKPRTVILDRPFVYMIINTETNVPVFTGVTDMLG